MKLVICVSNSLPFTQSMEKNLLTLKDYMLLNALSHMEPVVTWNTFAAVFLPEIFLREKYHEMSRNIMKYVYTAYVQSYDT